MSGRDYLHIWYIAQSAVILFLLLLIAAWEAYYGIRLVMVVIPVALIMLLAIVSATLPQLPHWLQLINRWLQAVCQPFILAIVWGMVTRILIARLQLPARGIVALGMLYYIVMFAPFASEIGGQFQWAVSRICYLFWWLSCISTMGVGLPMKFAGPHTFVVLISTGAVAAIAYFVMVTTVMRSWKLSWPGIKPQFGWGFSWWVLITLVLVDVLFTIWNAYGAGDSWKNMFFSYDFHGIRPTGTLTMQAFEAGVAEETLCRFGILGCALYAFRRFENRIPYAVLLSSALFGLIHYTNLAEQTFSLTTVQVLSAFAMGLFFCVVYLYTGQLWITMLMHFLIDWTSFTISGSAVMSGQAGAMDWITLAVQMVVFVGVTIWMMFGNRRHVMKRHADRLIGEDQRFGFRLQFN
ncbi:CPBP family intramembrane glutamic endopeptidase [Limosilactobacillus caecicola]|uniref:CPBP family intramembrane glutamic endopeptidase n=1 Tax=Limosilactobacillus caecicola TaxID=2941332 RepID=UPI0020416A5B|nr:CPBP family intramembrane glutamic endopeptidase [Limosilactobacillus caecicola]